MRISEQEQAKISLQDLIYEWVFDGPFKRESQPELLIWKAIWGGSDRLGDRQKTYGKYLYCKAGGWWVLSEADGPKWFEKRQWAGVIAEWERTKEKESKDIAYLAEVLAPLAAKGYSIESVSKAYKSLGS